MSGCDSWALFKFLQVVLCAICLLYKRWTDEQSSRLFFYLQKHSREWPFLNNVTQNQAGSWFADVTFGGYLIICSALFFAYLCGELRGSRKTEKFLLLTGAILFFGVGCLVISSFDSVPEDLVANALILGSLAILTACLFMIDICCCISRRDNSDVIKEQKKEFRMQKDVRIQMEKEKRKKLKEEKMEKIEKSKEQKMEEEKKSKGAETNGKIKKEIIGELSSSFKKKLSKKKEKSPNTVEEKNSALTEKPAAVENEVFQKTAADENVQVGRKRMNNRGFLTRQNVVRAKSDSEKENSYDYDEQTISRQSNLRRNSSESVDRRNFIVAGQSNIDEVDFRKNNISSDRRNFVVDQPNIDEVDHRNKINISDRRDSDDYDRRKLVDSPKFKYASSDDDELNFSSDDENEPKRRYKDGTRTINKENTKNIEIFRQENGITRKITQTNKTITEVQSSKISTTNPNKSDTPTSDESYEIQSRISKSQSSKAAPRRPPTPPTLPTQIKWKQQYSVPSTPTDPGYVLHTASHWPHVSPDPSMENRMSRNNERKLRLLHSDV